MINASCSQCSQKEDMINKYLKLIKLLKAKCQKTVKSFAKNNTLSSDTLQQSSYENSKSQQINQLSTPLNSNLNPEKGLVQPNNSSLCQLAIKIMSTKSKKALLKYSFNKIKELVNVSQQTGTSPMPCSLNLQGSLPSIIQQVLNYGKIMQQKSNFSLQNNRQLQSKIFNLELQNQFFLKKINSLQKQISNSQRRFQKQTQKKRESLETVAEQIREKTDLVAELQQTIKKYEKLFGKSIDNITLQTVLVQDADELKKTCLRLQNINQKLNNDIRNIHINFDELKKECLQLKSTNELLKGQNKTLRQSNFELAQILDRHSNMQMIYKKSLERLGRKIQAIQQKERQLYATIKMNSSGNMASTKNTELSVQEVILDKRQSLRQLDVEQKIEEIFSYLFHIKVENYQIDNLHLFDSDEIELLNSHKLNYNREDSFIQTKRQNIHKREKLNHSNFEHTHEVFYIKDNQANFENSFLCALQPTRTSRPASNPQIGNMKLIEMEVEKSKLIQKISQLKNLHMHIRNVILNFLKVLDMNNLRPETEGILQIVFEFFEYSEDEKACIFKEKKKKFWGIL